MSVSHVRLMQLDKAGPQADMRADDQGWDSGGIFDLNVRVRDVAAQSTALHALHWHGASPPIPWDSGGLDLSDTARLPNFGMALLRHPVRGIRVFAEHLARHRWPLEMPLTRVRLAPHGEVDLLAVRTPEGAWLEFYEAVA